MRQKLAIALLTMPQPRREELLGQVLAQVAKWRRDGLCSADCSDRRDALLSQPVEDMARALMLLALRWQPFLRVRWPGRRGSCCSCVGRLTRGLAPHERPAQQ